MNRSAPTAILFDLDDTLRVHGIPDGALEKMCRSFASWLKALGPWELLDAINDTPSCTGHLRRT